jgi:hypothetical protein
VLVHDVAHQRRDDRLSRLLRGFRGRRCRGDHRASLARFVLCFDVLEELLIVGICKPLVISEGEGRVLHILNAEHAVAQASDNGKDDSGTSSTKDTPLRYVLALGSFFFCLGTLMLGAGAISQ